VGAKAYRNSHIAGRGITDSRPFQIFEGSNDMLYAQISENFLRQMKKLKEKNLFSFMKMHELTSRSAEQMKDLFNFNIDTELPQRKLVALGQAIGRVVSMDMVHKLGDEGFRKDLVQNGIDMLQQEIYQLMGTFNLQTHALVVEDYRENSSWIKTCLKR